MFLYLFMYGILGYWIPLKEEEEEEKYVPRYYVRSVSIENGQPHVMERNFYLTMWHSFDRLQSHTHTLKQPRVNRFSFSLFLTKISAGMQRAMCDQ